MSRREDDTELDALASQVRAFPKLQPAIVAGLLLEVKNGDVEARRRVVEQQLAAVLAVALVRRTPAIDVFELYQEGSVAATVAVDEFAARGGRAAELRGYVSKVVERHLDDVLGREALQQKAVAQLVSDAELLEAAELVLRRELDRPPTSLEVATRLGWEAERVDLAGQMLITARRQFDEEILEYLDDE